MIEVESKRERYGCVIEKEGVEGDYYPWVIRVLDKDCVEVGLMRAETETDAREIAEKFLESKEGE